jgi:hypothetical protein
LIEGIDYQLFHHNKRKFPENAADKNIAGELLERIIILPGS